MKFRTERLPLLLLLLLLLLVLATHCSAGRSGDQPKVFSLLVSGDPKPKEYRVYFSTMSEFRKKNATELVYFLRVANKEFQHRFSPSEASCKANSSYCYISGSLPDLQPNWCDFGVVLRIASIDNDYCQPGECLNINSPIECAMRVQQDRKECQERKWPFEPCNYPPFVEPKNLSPKSTYTHATLALKPETIFLIGLSVFALATIAFSAFVFRRIQILRDNPRLIVLIPIEQGGLTTYGMFLPTNEEVKRVMLSPAYSFKATAVPFKKLL